MIYCIFGDIGSGKTLKALDWMRLAAEQGRRIFTNIALTPKCPYFEKAAFIDDDEFHVCRPVYKWDGRDAWWHFVPMGSLVVIDEADIYLDCLDHGRVGVDARIAHKQIRKRFIDVVYIVQNPENLYVRIRRLVNRWYQCEWNYRSSWLLSSLGAVGRRLSRFFVCEFNSPSFGESQIRRQGFFTFPEASAMFGWYRTDQLLGDTSFYDEGAKGHVKSSRAHGQSQRRGGGRGEGNAARTEAMGEMDSDCLRGARARSLDVLATLDAGAGWDISATGGEGRGAELVHAVSTAQEVR